MRISLFGGTVYDVQCIVVPRVSVRQRLNIRSRHGFILNSPLGIQQDFRYNTPRHK